MYRNWVSIFTDFSTILILLFILLWVVKYHEIISKVCAWSYIILQLKWWNHVIQSVLWGIKTILPPPPPLFSCRMSTGVFLYSPTESVILTNEKFGELMIFALLNMCTSLRLNKSDCLSILNLTLFGGISEDKLQESDFIKKTQDSHG